MVITIQHCMTSMLQTTENRSVSFLNDSALAQRRANTSLEARPVAATVEG